MSSDVGTGREKSVLTVQPVMAGIGPVAGVQDNGNVTFYQYSSFTNKVKVTIILKVF